MELPPVDLTYLTHIPEGDQSAVEKEAILIAGRNKNHLLEWTDFTDEEVCNSRPDLPKSAKACRQQKMASLWSYRTQLIDVRVRMIGKPLQTTWPDLNLADPVTLIDRYTRNVSDIGQMTSELFLAIREHPTLKSSPTKNALLFCLAWVVIYNLGEAHKVWTHDGHPAIADIPMDHFIQATLDRLVHDKIHIDSNAAKGLKAEHHHHENVLDLSPKYAANPLWEDPEVHLAELIPHELLHAEYDARGQLYPHDMGEVEAYLLGKKAFLITDSGAQQYLTTSLHFITQRVAKDHVACAKECSPLSRLIDKISARQTDTQIELPFAHHTLEVAQRELKTGRIDRTARKLLGRAYAQLRVDRMLRQIISQNFLEDAPAFNTMDPVAYHAWAAKKYQGLSDHNPMPSLLLTSQERAAFGKQGAEWRAVQQKAHDYLKAKTNQLFSIFYNQGEAAARTFCEHEYLPLVRDKELIDIVEHLNFTYDGIP